MSTTDKLTGLYTPGGRFIIGDLTTKQEKRYAEGPVLPEEEREYYFVVAVNKTQPGVSELVSTLYNYASGIYATSPVVLPQVQMGFNATAFSWKISDGDIALTDKKTGQLREIPEHIRGCYLFTFRSKYEFGACDQNGVNIDRGQIKRGDYVDVAFTASPNGKFDNTAGIILYPVAIRHLGYGEPIAAGVDAATAFADRQAVAPAGATPAPTATGQMPQQPQMGNAGGMSQATGTPQMGVGGASAGQMAQAPQTGGMPQASSPMGTSSPINPAQAGVAPHNGILHGPQTGGMPS